MKYIYALILLFLSLNLVSALTINDARSDAISPAGQGTLQITIENEDDDDVSDVTVSLDLKNTPFSTIGSSQDSVNEIDSDEKENFFFTLKADSDAEPGDYNIPYIIEYDNKKLEGTIGVSISTDSNLDFTSSLDNPIVGEKSRLSLKIINKGLGEVKFVTVRIFPEGYTLLSDDLVYIGNIDSDDFETADFDVIINQKTPNLIAQIEYEDLENKKSTKNIFLPLTVYSQERAIELGLKQKSNSSVYIILIILLVVAFFVYRTIRKIRMKKKINGQK